MIALLSLPVLGLMIWLSPLAKDQSPVLPLARVTLLSFALSSANVLLSGLSQHFTQLNVASNMLHFVSFYVAWPLLVSVWLAESFLNENWSLGTWGRILIGWMAVFELIRRFGVLDYYWTTLNWVLPIAMGIALYRIYRQHLPDPMLGLIPLMLFALYTQQQNVLVVVFEVGTVLYIGRRLLFEYARKNSQLSS